MEKPCPLLLTDGKMELKREMKELRKEMDALRQIYLRLHEIYVDRKRRYEAIDKEWALRDGRLKVIQGGKSTEPKKRRQMTQDQINDLIAELEGLIVS
jgi:hypothetical protein